MNNKVASEMSRLGINWEFIHEKLDDVFKERIRQNKKFGKQEHTPMHWIPILGEEYGEVCKAALEHHFDHHESFNAKIEKYEKELIEVIAVSFAMLESLHENQKNIFHGFKIGKPHFVDSENCQGITEKYWRIFSEEINGDGFITTTASSEEEVLKYAKQNILDYNNK